ncbi:MAG: thioredoxin family protein [Geminicoccaceae bacterium]|nr:thioredoxin family protein [Geminicoccaceae bacterium]MCS7268660.1 thioredoxin family protein [Geminicoccaceae bacterium]MCX7631000.1 thioredoxin family protein [Geminicoccaceae bacterium]
MAAVAPICNFGEKAKPFDLLGTDGKRYRLEDVKGPKGLVVVFMCNHCPYVKAIIDKLIRDARDLKEIGVNTVAICSNDAEAYPEDSFENMKRWAEEKQFPFPYLHDETQEVARAYGAVCTPDFFGYNANLELQYRGRLDASGKSPVEGARRELYEAMKLVAETGRGPAEQYPSMGCSIKWKKAA